MQKKKSKIIYVDTNIILDFKTDKETNSVVFMKSIKSRGWKLITSTFTMIEISEHRRNEVFLWDKLSKYKSLNNIIKSIKNPRKEKKLKSFHYEQVQDWIDNLLKELPNFSTLDLEGKQDENYFSSWQLALDLAIFSNLNAKDIIHLATAVAASQNKKCDFFVTSDGDFLKEAKVIIEKIKKFSKLKILKPKEFIEIYPPIKKKT